jgi:hypothetical protein
MSDIQEKILELMDLFDEDEVTTADKINRPEPKQSVKEIELFNEFNIRNPKAGGGMLVQPGFGGVRQGYKSKRVYDSPDVDAFSDALLDAYAKDDITKIVESGKSTKFSNVITAIESGKDKSAKLAKVIKNTGLDEETIFNLLDDRKAYIDLAREGGPSGASPRAEDFYKKAENWIIKNSKRYADPDKFKKAFIRTFGKNNDLIKTMKRLNVPGARKQTSVPFSPWFKETILGSTKGSSAGYNFNQLNNIFKTSIYTNNENVRNKLTKEINRILSIPLEKGGKFDIRNQIKNSPLFKKFGFDKQIRGPIARLLANEVGQELLDQISSFRDPYLGTTELIRFLKNNVDPKYKSMFEEAAKAADLATKNKWPEAKKILKMKDDIMFDHKIPKQLVNLGYADELEYIKLNPTSAEFNTRIKNPQFDQKIIKLVKDFEKAKTLDAKANVVTKMNKLKNDFSKKYGGYLDEISINVDKTGKPIFTSAASPITKKTDFVSSLGKSLTQTGEINKKQLKNLSDGPRLGALDVPSMFRRLSPATRKLVSGFGGVVLPEVLFYQLDKRNRMSKGQSEKEAAAGALESGTLGLYNNKAYMEELKKTAKSMGIDSNSFDSAYQLNLLTNRYKQNSANYEKNYEQLLEMGDEKRAEDLKKNFDRYTKNIQNRYSLLANNISDNVMNTVGASPLIMKEGRENITQKQFNKPFFDMQDVALEKLKREAQSVYPIRARKVNPAEGSVGTGFYNMLDFIGQGFKNIALGRANPNLMDLSERQKQERLLKDMTGQELYRYNKDFRDFTYENPITKADLENLLYEQPGLFAGGGIAKIAGVDQGPPPESGPNSQGLSGLFKRVKNI